jgi:protein O-GlcNAc transferase
MINDASLTDITSRALTALAQDDLAAALGCIAEVQAHAPDSTLAYHLVGLASLRLNEPGKAVEAFEHAHRLAPEIREHAEVLSILCGKLGRLVDSLYYQKLGLGAAQSLGIADLVPAWLGGFDEAFFNIEDRPLLKEAQKHVAVGDYAAAAESFRKEVEADHGSTEAWRGLAMMHLLRGQSFDGLRATEALLSIDRSQAADLALHGELLAHAGRFDQAIACQKRAARLDPANADLAWQVVRTLARWPGYPAAALGAAVSDWGRRFASKQARPTPAPASELAGRHLRLGVVSTSWANAGGLDLIVPVLEQLDRRRIRLHVYVSGVVRSPLARRLRARSNSWQELTELDDDTAAIIIRNDALDILIDLDGPTRGARPGLLVGGPAAIVLVAYGLPDGVLAMGCDGVIGDACAYPPDAAHVVRVPGGIASLPNDLPPIERNRSADAACAFGSLAQRWQIGPATIAAWADILVAVPNSILVLDLAQLGGALGVQDFLEMVQPHVAPDRIMIKTEASQLSDYLNEVDILLDPLDNPHPDEAVAGLTLGVPVVTCRSAMPRAALLASWLERIGLGNLVADDLDGYISRATALAVPTEHARVVGLITTSIAAERLNGAVQQANELATTLIKLAMAGSVA